jgi:hypothetical protein
MPVHIRSPHGDLRLTLTNGRYRRASSPSYASTQSLARAPT